MGSASEQGNCFDREILFPGFSFLLRSGRLRPCVGSDGFPLSFFFFADLSREARGSREDIKRRTGMTETVDMEDMNI
jgi:hypothetical protein